MRKTLLMSAALLGMTVAAPAFAQGGVSATNSPPAPNAGVSAPEPTNSLPPGAPTATFTRPGDTVGSTRTAPPPPTAMSRPMTGVRPMRGQQQHSQEMSSEQMRHHGMSQSARTRGRMQGDDRFDGDGNAPLSRNASNTGAGAARSEIAPHLPNPEANARTPTALLNAAERAVRARQTGRAQEAVERAESALLNRSVDPASANAPSDDPAVQHLTEARRALGRGDMNNALRLIQSAQATVGAGMQGGNMGQRGMDQSSMGQGGMGQGNMGQRGMSGSPR